jgi:L,D-peptidoglycan transpeptidase YkuD (ErfK/YbiS/YcfS/YnhG family)
VHGLFKAKVEGASMTSRLVPTIRLLCRSDRSTTGLLVLGTMTLRCSLGRSGRRFCKREGDGASPRGIWKLRRLFYRADRIFPPLSGLRGLVLRPRDGWCETVGDRNYNRLVRIPYATSHETMMRSDHLYDIVIELSHNERPRVQGLGSAVFLHLRRPDGGPTAGCIAVSLSDMRKLLRVIGPSGRIVI